MASTANVNVPAKVWTKVSDGEKYVSAQMPKVGKHYFAVSTTQPSNAPDDDHPYQHVINAAPIELGQLGATDYLWLYLDEDQVVGVTSGDDV